MEKYTGLLIKCDEPSAWTLIFQRQADGSIEIGLAHGQHAARQGVTLSPPEAADFLKHMGGET